MTKSGDVMLGGKLFNFVNYDAITVLHEHYVMKFMRETGLDKVLPLEDGESDEQYQARMQARLVDTLRLPELLAGYLLPMGKGEGDWTPEMAKETSDYIAKLTAARDKAEVHRLGMVVTFDFFRAGLASIRTFESASALPETTPANLQSSGRDAAA